MERTQTCQDASAEPATVSPLSGVAGRVYFDLARFGAFTEIVGAVMNHALGGECLFDVTHSASFVVAYAKQRPKAGNTLRIGEHRKYNVLKRIGLGFEKRRTRKGLYTRRSARIRRGDL